MITRGAEGSQFADFAIVIRQGLAYGNGLRILLKITSDLDGLAVVRPDSSALGTFVQINIISSKSDSAKAEQSLEQVYKKIEEYENIFDHRHESGNLHKFNSSTSILKKDDDKLFLLLKESIYFAGKTR